MLKYKRGTITHTQYELLQKVKIKTRLNLL